MSFVSASTIPGFVVRSHAMDGVYSIGAGLVLRVVVGAVTSNVKLGGTLVGLWEGVVLLHFVNKSPSSTDPYLAYGVRLFVDFLVTESVFRFVIVLLWSGLGMVLADVAPSVWNDTGLKRQWNHVRRDLSRSVRTLSKRRTPMVRFSPSPTIPSAASSVISTFTRTTTRTVPATSTVVSAPGSISTPVAVVHPPIIIRKRSLVPGTFPGAEWSETETELDENERADPSLFPPRPSHVTISLIEPSEDSYSNSDYNGTISPPSPSGSTASLDYSDDPSAYNPVDIPSEVEEDIIVSSNRRTTDSDRETTPKQTTVVLPPTPADSVQDLDSAQWGDREPEEVPPSSGMPNIPDPEPLDEWETIYAEAEPPVPPPKDDVPVHLPADEETEEHQDQNTAGPSYLDPDRSPTPINDHPTTPFIETPIPDPSPTSTSENGTPEQADTAPESAAAAQSEANPPQSSIRTPPPSFEDLYGEPDLDGAADPAAALPPSKPPTEHAASSQVGSRPVTPTPIPSPGTSLRNALSLRKQALVITARLAELTRKRTSSKKARSATAKAAAVLTKIEIEAAEKELAAVNEKAEGAFVGAYNPSSASLYEFNTTGLTPEEAVRQTEARLGKLLLAPVPPPGTTDIDRMFDYPNRSALTVTMEQTIKGRLVKQAMLNAMRDSGLNFTEDRTRPNIIYIQLPMTAADAEPAVAEEPTKAEDEGDKEY